MQKPDEMSPGNSDVENALRRLTPVPIQTSQREIWYRAGVEAGRRGVRIWRAAVAAMTLATALLLATAHHSTLTTPQQQIVQRQSPPQFQAPDINSSTANSSAAYARLRATITGDGFDARSSSDPPASNGTPPPPSRHFPPGSNDSEFFSNNLTPRG